MAHDGGPPLPETTPEPLTPELAPFVAQARARLEQATDGLDHEAAVGFVSVERDSTARRLAVRFAIFGGLEAVVDRVADQVGQRVLDRLEDRLVELGVLALELEADVLAEPDGDVPDDAALSVALKVPDAQPFQLVIHDGVCEVRDRTPGDRPDAVLRAPASTVVSMIFGRIGEEPSPPRRSKQQSSPA